MRAGEQQLLIMAEMQMVLLINNLLMLNQMYMKVAVRGTMRMMDGTFFKGWGIMLLRIAFVIKMGQLLLI